MALKNHDNQASSSINNPCVISPAQNEKSKTQEGTCPQCEKLTTSNFHLKELEKRQQDDPA
jgi:hypothetical protein